jgi:hypothetical protein
VLAISAPAAPRRVVPESALAMAQVWLRAPFRLSPSVHPDRKALCRWTRAIRHVAQLTRRESLEEKQYESVA